MATLPIVATFSFKTSGAATAGNAPVTFHGWSGWVSGLGIDIDKAKRLGQSGSVAQGTGKTADNSQVTAWKFFTNKAEALAFCAIVENMPNPTPYSLVDPWARKINVRVLDAQTSLEFGKGAAVGIVAATHKVMARFNLERQVDG